MSADSELPVPSNPAVKPLPVKPLWSDATETPLVRRFSASHRAWSAQVRWRHGVAVTGVPPAVSRTERFCASNCPEPILYRRAMALVLTVSQPPEVLAVYAAGVNPSRPIALNVASSVNFPSPAYSVRIRVGERIWKRASPAETVGIRG